MGLVGQGGTGRLGPGEQRVNVRLAANRVADAELAALRRSERDVRVFGQLRAGVEPRRSPP